MSLRQRGITLIELVVVVAIVAVIGTISAGAMKGYTSQVRQASASYKPRATIRVATHEAIERDLNTLLGQIRVTPSAK